MEEALLSNSNNKQTKPINRILKTIPLPLAKPTPLLVLKHYHNSNNCCSSSTSLLTLHNTPHYPPTLQLFIKAAHTQDPSLLNRYSIIHLMLNPSIDLPLRLLTIKPALTMVHPNLSLDKAKDLVPTESWPRIIRGLLDMPCLRRRRFSRQVRRQYHHRLVHVVLSATEQDSPVCRLDRMQLL